MFTVLGGAEWAKTIITDYSQLFNVLRRFLGGALANFQEHILNRTERSFILSLLREDAHLAPLVRYAETLLDNPSQDATSFFGQHVDPFRQEKINAVMAIIYMIIFPNRDRDASLRPYLAALKQGDLGEIIRASPLFLTLIQQEEAKSQTYSPSMNP